MKTGVLVHGFNLFAENWRRVVWGDAPDALGRLPQALLTAHTLDASIIVLGSGASKRKFEHQESAMFGQELLESEYTREYLCTFFNRMLYFKPWSERVMESHDHQLWNDYKAACLSKIYLDTKSQNTREELVNAGLMFADHQVDRVVLVSSPTHIVRSLRDANDVYHNDERFGGFRHDIHAVPCVTCYKGTRASDVMVLEPPHRPDRDDMSTHQRIRRILALQKLEHDDLIQFIDEFEDLLRHFEEISSRGALEPEFEQPLNDLLDTLRPRFNPMPADS